MVNKMVNDLIGKYRARHRITYAMSIIIISIVLFNAMDSTIRKFACWMRYKSVFKKLGNCVLCRLCLWRNYIEYSAFCLCTFAGELYCGQACTLNRTTLLPLLAPCLQKVIQKIVCVSAKFQALIL